MKKRKRLKTRIFALLACLVILAVSVVPCFAVSEQGYVSRNVISVPINYYLNYRVFYDGRGYIDYPFEFFLPNAEEIDYSIINSMYPYQSPTIRYDYTTGYHYVQNMQSSDSFIDGLVTSYNAEHIVMSGNFIINPADDEFVFKFYSDNEFETSISVVYVELGETSYGEVKTLVISDYLSTSYEFNLSDALNNRGLRDVDVFVYSFEIDVFVPSITDYVGVETYYFQSDSLIERNTNAFVIDLDGNMVEVENSMIPYEDFFNELGVRVYKESFENYTTDYTSWIGTAVGGFLNMELFPFFSIGGVLLICVALGLVGYFIKVFMGG